MPATAKQGAVILFRLQLFRMQPRSMLPHASCVTADSDSLPAPGQACNGHGLAGRHNPASIGEPECFLRKAIGWALRACSHTNTAWLAAFVETHAGLSELSRREALKMLARGARQPQPQN